MGAEHHGADSGNILLSDMLQVVAYTFPPHQLTLHVGGQRLQSKFTFCQTD